MITTIVAFSVTIDKKYMFEKKRKLDITRVCSQALALLQSSLYLTLLYALLASPLRFQMFLKSSGWLLQELSTALDQTSTSRRPGFTGTVAVHRVQP